MPNHNWESNRIRVAIRLLLTAIICLGMGSVIAHPQAISAEDQLRERIAGFWDALAKHDPVVSGTYVHPDSLNLFYLKFPKTSFQKWKVGELAFNENKTECLATIITTRILPIGTIMDWPVKNKWIFYSGDWFLSMPEEAGESPLVALFRNEELTRELTDDLIKPAEKADVSEPTSEELRLVRDRLSPDVENVGVINYGEKVTLRYHYTNQGSEPIRITGVQSECHCTVVRENQQDIPPGATGTLVVGVDTNGLPMGLIQKVIWINFSDLPIPVRLQPELDIRPNFIIRPEELDFGTVMSGESVEKQIQIVNQSNQVVEVISVMNSNLRIHPSADKEIIEPGEILRVTVVFSPKKSEEVLDRVMIYTDHKAQPMMTVRVRGMGREQPIQ